jgi:hypothetical protein
VLENAQQEILMLKRQIDDIKRPQSMPPPQLRYSPPMTHPRIQHSACEDTDSPVPLSTTAILSNMDEHRRQQQASFLPPQQPRVYSPPPMARQRMQQQHQQPFDEQPPDLLEMNFTPPRDLISPAQVGIDVHANKNRKRQELKTKSEMRSKSLLV